MIIAVADCLLCVAFALSSIVDQEANNRYLGPVYIEFVLAGELAKSAASDRGVMLPQG
jgi:hypothetical protein